MRRARWGTSEPRTTCRLWCEPRSATTWRWCAVMPPGRGGGSAAAAPGARWHGHGNASATRRRERRSLLPWRRPPDPAALYAHRVVAVVDEDRLGGDGRGSVRGEEDSDPGHLRRAEVVLQWRSFEHRAVDVS